MAILQYLAVLVLLGHGLGHMVGILPAWASFDVGGEDTPWILPGDHKMDSTVGKIWGVVWLAAMVLFVVSSAGVLMNKEWWRQWAIIGSIVSIVAIVPWWNSVVVGAKAGVALDVAIILVLSLPWGEKITDFFDVP